MTTRKIKDISATLLAVALALILGILLSGCGKTVPQEDPLTDLPPAQPPAVSAPLPAALPTQAVSTVNPAVPGETLLTREQAQTVALKHAGLTAGQVTGLRCEFDVDDGVKESEVEFRHDGWEYDYEIHAVSAAVLSFDKERD